MVNRPVGRLLAAACYRAGLTPNQVTGISALCSAIGVAVLLAMDPSWVSGILVWFLLALGYAFDSADGQVARLRGGGSPPANGWTMWWIA
nr:CDP-alcohol phosphatidyltransferase family protein [Kocuria atrinae]